MLENQNFDNCLFLLVKEFFDTKKWEYKFFYSFNIHIYQNLKLVLFQLFELR